MVVFEQKRVSTTVSIVVGEWRDGFVLAPVVDEVIVVEMGLGAVCGGAVFRARARGSVFRV